MQSTLWLLHSSQGSWRSHFLWLFLHSRHDWGKRQKHYKCQFFSSSRSNSRLLLEGGSPWSSSEIAGCVFTGTTRVFRSRNIQFGFGACLRSVSLTVWLFKQENDPLGHALKVIRRRRVWRCPLLWALTWVWSWERERGDFCRRRRAKYRDDPSRQLLLGIWWSWPSLNDAFVAVANYRLEICTSPWSALQLICDSVRMDKYAYRKVELWAEDEAGVHLCLALPPGLFCFSLVSTKPQVCASRRARMPLFIFCLSPLLPARRY